MGVYLSNPQRNKRTVIGEGEGFIYAASSVQGWRNSMEDAEICCPNLDSGIQVYGVFDGHGGSEVSLYVQEIFPESLLKNAEFQNRNFEAALVSTFMMMDEKMRTEEGRQQLQRLMKDKHKTESTAGCTANVALIANKNIYVANSVLCSKGQPVRLSQDHKPNDEIEYKRIKDAGGEVVNGRVNGNLNLSRALGDLQYKKNESIPQDQQLISAKPDVLVHAITEDDDFILIGCDGVWETMSDLEILTFIREQIANDVPSKTIVEELLDKLIAPDLMNGGGCDNMTCILVTLKDIAVLREKFSTEIANKKDDAAELSKQSDHSIDEELDKDAQQQQQLQSTEQE